MFRGNEATSNVVGVLLLVAMTLILAAGVVGISTMGIGLESAPKAKLAIDSVDASENKIVLTHEGGEAFDVSKIEILTYVDEEPLEKQLEDLPAFGVTGYSWPKNPGPIFKGTTDHVWEVGEKSRFEVASTNSLQIDAGDTVTVKIIHQPSGSLIAESSAVAP